MDIDIENTHVALDGNRYPNDEEQNPSPATTAELAAEADGQSCTNCEQIAAALRLCVIEREGQIHAATCGIRTDMFCTTPKKCETVRAALAAHNED